MGRIFSPEEVLEERIPQSEDFHRAKDVFKELAELAIKHEVFDGSFIFGSVAIGTPNIRSDLDIFISLNNPAYSGIEETRKIIDKVRDGSNSVVPVNVLVYTKDSLEKGRHEIDRFFGEHLSSNDRIVEGNDPSNYIIFPDQSSGAIIGSYLAQKKRRLTRSCFDDSLIYAEGNGLQRMLELPSAVGRKVLQAMHEVDYDIEPVKRSASASTVIDKTRQFTEKYGINDKFEHLVALNGDYNELLSSYIDGSVLTATYESEIKELHSKLPVAIDWLEETEEVVLPKLSVENQR